MLVMVRAPEVVHRAMRFENLKILPNSKITMRSHSPGRRSRHSRGGSRRRGDRPRHQGAPTKAPQKTFWQRLAAFFAGNGKSGQQRPAQPARNGHEPWRPGRKVESVEVTSPRLYVGNLSFDAAGSDLFEV